VAFERRGRETGPGQATGQVETTPSVTGTYTLFNFNIDGDMLKEEHRRFLDRHVVPLLKAHRIHARLTGTASRTGGRDHNRQLSLARVLRVKEHLRKRGIPESKLPGSAIVAAGEDLSTSKSDEDALDRGVRIRFAIGIRPMPIPPKVVLPTVVIAGENPPITLPPVVIAAGEEPGRSWTIRQIYGHSVGIGHPLGIGGGFIQYNFLLVNRSSRQMAQCTFFGPAVSGGPPPSPRVGGSVTLPSKTWSNFKTPRPVKFADFNGAAKWDEGGIGMGTEVSLSVLQIYSVDSRFEVSTGATVGLPSASTSLGTFSCKEPVQLELP
jgi:hypothetical protein